MPADLPFGLISIKLKTVNIGDTVVVAIYFSEPVARGAKWYKYDSANGWQDYSVHAIFAADRRTLELQLKDGGYGDSDGVENGIIVDPGGVAVPAAPSSAVENGESDLGSGLESDSGSGASCFIATVASND
jgi:hypothetical protein